jgi:sigma-B regulation protein RsbU (phosphoserine phosphatase)
MTSPSLIHELRPKIIERRMRLQAAVRSVSADYVNDLLAEVDAALEKMESGSYGLCETCHDPIEADRLERNPLARFCLDHLTGDELVAHEQDLALATQIQASLLPDNNVKTGSWETHYRYEPAGVVSGDYCEILAGEGDALFFALGDVTGKGVAASLLMTHLSAIFRSLRSHTLCHTGRRPYRRRWRGPVQRRPLPALTVASRSYGLDGCHGPADRAFL